MKTAEQAKNYRIECTISDLENIAGLLMQEYKELKDRGIDLLYYKNLARRIIEAKQI
jgi:calcineurin-like phosphoesterase